jgi:2-phosphosulfolactate phosphatase
LEDSLFAGALANGLKDFFSTDCDTTIALENLYVCHKENLKNIISQASHTKRLQNENIEEDIDFCLTLNKYSTIGIFHLDCIKSIQE